jgi:hypothetical protein
MTALLAANGTTTASLAVLLAYCGMLHIESEYCIGREGEQHPLASNEEDFHNYCVMCGIKSPTTANQRRERKIIIK